MTRFVDSATPPTLAQVKAAVAQGITAWAFYLAGPGAEHNWTPADVEVLREGGITQGLPIYVPKLDLTGTPKADAQALAEAMATAQVYGVGVLDTEASMRGNPHLMPYVDTFTDELVEMAIVPVVYGGGTYVTAGDHPWWIHPGATSAPAGTAYQVGSGSIAGLSVDFDIAGPGFPFASLVAPVPPPTPGGPTVPASTDVVASWFVPGSNGSSGFMLTADGGLESFGGATVGQVTYVAVANDGKRYHFGPNGDHAVFSYPGLPVATREGTRYFLSMEVLAYQGKAV